MIFRRPGLGCSFVIIDLWGSDMVGGNHQLLEDNPTLDLPQLLPSVGTFAARLRPRGRVHVQIIRDCTGCGKKGNCLTA